MLGLIQQYIQDIKKCRELLEIGQSEFDYMRQAHKDAEAEVDALNKDAENIRKKCLKLMQIEHQAYYIDVHEAVDRLISEFEELQEENQKLIENNSDLENQIDELNNTISVQETDIDHYQDQLKGIIDI